jgi:SEC-C motif-containing protein
MVLRLKTHEDCVCGSGKTYADCCLPFHEGKQLAPTPEALMRSRYSAYVLKLTDYLIATWHASTAPGDLEISPFMKWLGLEVLHAEMSGDVGVVEFVARYKDNGRAGKLHELSRFVREGGKWLYIDGQMMTAESADS